MENTIRQQVFLATVELGQVFSKLESIPQDILGAYISYQVMQKMKGIEASDIEALIEINQILHSCKYSLYDNGLFWIVPADFVEYLKQIEKSIGIELQNSNRNKQAEQIYKGAKKPYGFEIEENKLKMIYQKGKWNICFKIEDGWYDLNLRQINCEVALDIDVYIKAKHSDFGDMLLC